MKKAMYFEKVDNERVRCFLCPHSCNIRPGGAGICGARENSGGELYSMNYGRITSLALDPIEKKPLLRYKPGSMILSAGTFGCNLKCSFCQNWSIAHERSQSAGITPEELVERALASRKHGGIGLAYTYNEPAIWYEFVLDVSRLAKNAGLDNILVTNGFISGEPLLKLLPYIDAMNIDVKAYTEKFYRDICGAELGKVKETVEISALHCHIEVTTLVIPGLNDSPGEIEGLAKWLSAVSDEIPLHLTRFFPSYRMKDRPITPFETLKRAEKEARSCLKHVFLGNVW